MNALLEAKLIMQLNMLIPMLLVLLLIAVITDIHSRKIPNLLIVAGLVIAMIGQLFLPSGEGWQAWLLGMLAGFAAFLPLYLLHGMAAGDVKLMSAVGAFVGWGMALKIALVTFIIGGIMGIIYILVKGRTMQAWHNICAILLPIAVRNTGVSIENTDISGQSVGSVPYAGAIALGTLTVLYLQYWY